MGNIYGYARASTNGHLKNAITLENQEQQLRSHGACYIYRDSFDGTKPARPELERLLSILEKGDTLIVTKLDRIARSMSQGIEIITDLIENGVRVNILNIGVMDNTASSKLMRNMFFAFAEFERDMIVERTQEGKAIAKSKSGFKEGRPPKFTPEQIKYALGLLDSGNSYAQVEKMTQISKSTLARAKRSRMNSK